jgi:myo-inositol-1(or 4)-monophosphatase
MTDPILAADVAQAAARAGGAALMARRLERLDIEYKDARANLVTVADRESQAAIADVILTAFPGHAIDGEEGTAGNFDASDVWYVDPLDGTTNFTHGLPFSCVSEALRSSAARGSEASGGGDATVAGAVYDPLRDEMFVAARGGGATLNGVPVGVSDVTGLLTLFGGQPHVTAGRADVVASNGYLHPELIGALRGLDQEESL